MIINAVSVLFAAAAISATWRYISTYRMEESPSTLLFGFWRLRYTAILYFAGVAAAVLLSFILFVNI